MANGLKPMHIAVIDPGGRVPELDNFNRLVLRHPEIRFTYHLPALFGMSSLQFLEESPEALIVFGSSHSVKENLPWQEPIHAWLKEKMDEGVPTLGICYGHQLIAYLYGSEIDFALETQEKYKGLREITLEKSGFWTKGRGRFIVSHREIVKTLPVGFEVCGTSPEAEFELIRHTQKPIWGMQSHPEAGPEFIRNSVIPLKAGEESLAFQSGDDFMQHYIDYVGKLRKI